jgi:transglutaminase-like putative cysteine protease
MGFRLGQLAGLLALVLSLGRLARLLQSGPEHPPWQLILVAGVFLGGIAWWLLSQVTTSRALRLTIFGAGAVLLVMRITAPTTLFAGVLPTTETVTGLGNEIALAWETIATGIPPVEPSAGLLAILAVLMWVVGAFFAWGSSGGPHAALFLPPLVMYLQFAVFDRTPAGLGWMGAAALAVAGAAVSLAMERRDETGRARDTEGRPLGRRSMVMAVAMATVLGLGSVSLANGAAEVVSEYGNAPWRSGDGLGPGPGSGVAYDGLVELRQRVLNQSETPVFTARLAADTPPELNPYWTVDTLDVFNGVEWARSNTTSRRYEPGLPFVDTENLYRGTTYELLQTVQIQALSSVLAPTAGTPIEIQDPGAEAESPRTADEFYSVGGISVGVSNGVARSDRYQLRTLVTDRRADLGALATSANGELSPIFAEAALAGEFPHEPATPELDQRAELPDSDRYLQLPPNTPSTIFSRARSVTSGHTTDFEAAWMLQSWFRDSGEFTYSTEVSTGHDALVLADWLDEEGSVNYRTGYCEQFAAAMAVLARAADIPSRVVWGFTPGDVDENGVITVRDTNAHAWVELWIEPFGWYPFDPTPRAEQTDFASQPASITASVDPADYIDAPDDNPTDIPFDPAQGDQSIGNIEPEALDDSADATPRWWLIALVAVLPLLAAVPVVKRLRRRRRLHKVREGDITAAWDEIVDRLTDLGVEVSPTQTPLEVARSTDHALIPLAQSYSASIYGGKAGLARESDLVSVEWWIESHYQGAERARAAMSLRSLLRRV